MGKIDEKTNLYVFLTPRVIQSPEESQTLYDLKKKDIEIDLRKGERRNLLEKNLELRHQTL